MTWECRAHVFLKRGCCSTGRSSATSASTSGVSPSYGRRGRPWTMTTRPEEAAFRLPPPRLAGRQRPGTAAADRTTRRPSTPTSAGGTRRLYRGGWLGLSWPKDVRRAGDSARSTTPSSTRSSAPAGIAHAAAAGRVAGSGHPRLRHRGAAAAAPARPAERRHRLVPGVQRAGRRLRPGRRCARPPSSTATSTSSPGRSCGPAGAQFADWCLLLVRTDRDAPQAQGHHRVHRAHGHARHHGAAVASRPGAGPGSARCSSTGPRSPSPTASARRATGGRWPRVVLAYERGPSELGVIATYRHELRRLVPRPAAATRSPRKRWRAPTWRSRRCRLHLLESLTRGSTGRRPAPARRSTSCS